MGLLYGEIGRINVGIDKNDYEMQLKDLIPISRDSNNPYGKYIRLAMYIVYTL